MIWLVLAISCASYTHAWFDAYSAWKDAECGSYARARKRYDQHIAHDPQDVRAMYNAAHVAFQQEDYPGAAAYCATLTQRMPHLLDDELAQHVHYTHGNAAFLAGDYHTAYEQFDTFLSYQPNHDRAQYKRELAREMLEEQEQDEDDSQDDDQSGDGSEQDEDDQSDAGDQQSQDGSGDDSSDQSQSGGDNGEQSSDQQSDGSDDGDTQQQSQDGSSSNGNEGQSASDSAQDNSGKSDSQNSDSSQDSDASQSDSGSHGSDDEQEQDTQGGSQSSQQSDVSDQQDTGQQNDAGSSQDENDTQQRDSGEQPGDEQQQQDSSQQDQTERDAQADARDASQDTTTGYAQDQQTTPFDAREEELLAKLSQVDAQAYHILTQRQTAQLARQGGNSEYDW